MLKLNKRLLVGFANNDYVLSFFTCYLIFIIIYADKWILIKCKTKIIDLNWIWHNERENSMSAQPVKFSTIVTYVTVRYYPSWREIECEWLLVLILFLEKQVLYTRRSISIKRHYITLLLLNKHLLRCCHWKWNT